MAANKGLLFSLFSTNHFSLLVGDFLEVLILSSFPYLLEFISFLRRLPLSASNESSLMHLLDLPNPRFDRSSVPGPRIGPSLSLMDNFLGRSKLDCILISMSLEFVFPDSSPLLEIESSALNCLFGDGLRETERRRELFFSDRS